jgi:hypothetical protein
MKIFFQAVFVLIIGGTLGLSIKLLIGILSSY